MALSRRALKVLSIVQLIMAPIFFSLGILDHFEVRFVLTSFTLMPCWIAVLVSTLLCSYQLQNTVCTIYLTFLFMLGITCEYVDCCMTRTGRSKMRVCLHEHSERASGQILLSVHMKNLNPVLETISDPLLFIWAIRF